MKGYRTLWLPGTDHARSELCSATGVRWIRSKGRRMR
jgi:valyl-tRNA synthetase